MHLGNATRLVRSLATSAPVVEDATHLASAKALTETKLEVRHHWRQLSAQLHQEPARVGPLLVQPVPQTQLIVQLSGALRLQVTEGSRRRSYDSGPGSLFLTAAHQSPYELEWQAQSPEPVRTLHLYLDNALLAETALAVGVATPAIRDGSCVADPLLQQLGQTLAQGLSTPARPDELYADAVAQLLAAHLVRHHCHVPAPPPARAHGLLRPSSLRQLQDYVQAHLAQPLSIAELATVVCLSPYHFCRVFRRSTGLSPTQYVTTQRLEQARRLLQQGQLNVTQVAYAVGYQNPSYFAQLFRRYAGLAPAGCLPRVAPKASRQAS